MIGVLTAMIAVPFWAWGVIGYGHGAAEATLELISFNRSIPKYLVMGLAVAPNIVYAAGTVVRFSATTAQSIFTRTFDVASRLADRVSPQITYGLLCFFFVQVLLSFAGDADLTLSFTDDFIWPVVLAFVPPANNFKS